RGACPFVLPPGLKNVGFFAGRCLHRARRPRRTPSNSSSAGRKETAVDAASNRSRRKGRAVWRCPHPRLDPCGRRSGLDLFREWWFWAGILVIVALVGVLIYLRTQRPSDD